MNKKGFIPFVVVAFWGMMFGAAVVWNYVQTPKGAARLKASKGVQIGDKIDTTKPIWAR